MHVVRLGADAARVLQKLDIPMKMIRSVRRVLTITAMATFSNTLVWAQDAGIAKRPAHPEHAHVSGSFSTLTFAPLVEKVAPSVVTIFTTKNLKAGTGMDGISPFFDSPNLRRFFGGRSPQ